MKSPIFLAGSHSLNVTDRGSMGFSFGSCSEGGTARGYETCSIHHVDLRSLLPPIEEGAKVVLSSFGQTGK